MRPFTNEPALELRRADVRDSLVAALGELEDRFPIEVPLVVGGDRVAAAGALSFESTDPGRPERVVALAACADADDARTTVEAAAGAFPEWRDVGAGARAEVLVRAASILRERRLELAALEVRECAKPWPEADADVCEAIDFLEYYAREALRLAEAPPLVQAPGERNEMHYAPRGVAVVIAPWNFPLAIPTGMTAAALAAGNAAILKPAEQSPACALALVDALLDAGVPPGAIALAPGYGEAGAALVRDPGVHVIAFTGSSAVGLEIVRAGAETPPDQKHVKRVIAEMGGKNCVIVDSDADLDEAVPGIVHSAFDYAGQKCSACSRVLAHEAVVDQLLERLSGAIATLEVGQAEAFGTDVPPLIEREARDRVQRYAVMAAEGGRVVASSGAVAAEGWFCAPTLATDLRPDSPVLRDEIFGPLLTVEAVPSVSAACDILDDLPFALTGGLFSRNPGAVREVVRRTPVGNLYVNRHITGAMVGRQPFGGNRRSGVGSKAGGPDYLLQFTEPHVVSENTMRHGLVVE